MTLTSSTLQIQRHEYFEDLNLIIFVGISVLSFYAINMDFVSLFQILFFSDFESILFDVLYQFK